jgi:hypothetical protein
LPDSGFFLETDASSEESPGVYTKGGRMHVATEDAAIDNVNNINGFFHGGAGIGLSPGRYASGMKAMVSMSNATFGLNKACVAAHSTPSPRTPTTGRGDAGAGHADAADAWRCIFAEVVAQHLATPTFALQSAYDSWQLSNEMAPGAVKNVSAVNQYGARVRTALNTTLLAGGAAGSNKHGAFIESCEHHCFSWGAIQIDGDVQAAAFQTWYEWVNAVGSPPDGDVGGNSSIGGGRRVWNQTVAFPCTACCHGGGG